MALVTLALSGCAYQGSAVRVSPDVLDADGWLRVGELPSIHAKGDPDGGAAALARVLAYWRAPTRPTDIAAARPALTSGGITSADELRAYARSRGFSALVLRGELEFVRHELSEQRPVIVALIKRFGLARASPRYEVVVGYHPTRQLVATLDGAGHLQQMPVEGFLSEWERSERLLLVVLPGSTVTAPRELPGGTSADL